MTESESAVMISEPPVFEPPSGPPYLPPQSPPPPFGYGHGPTPSPAPKRHRVRAAIVAVAALVAGGTAAIVIESQQGGGQTTATTKPAVSSPSNAPASSTPAPSTPTSNEPSANEPLPTVASQPTTTKTLDTDAIVALVDPAVVDITTALDGGEAAGTGMVLTPSGLVLTNNHVIEGATEIEVQIGGSGPTHPAHVVGYDPSDDVALIQIEGVSDLTTVAVGDSASLAEGDRVVTIGNALGASGPHAVSTGSIDGLDQTITANDLTGDSESLSGLIQFDATIQPGDSGGPLVNRSGQVIGMNTAASVSLRRGLQSTAGYAIPIDTALEIAAKIQAGEDSSTIHIGDRAILGVQIVGSRPFDDPGVRVAAVTPSGPAAEAGIERGAIITAIDDTTITTVEDLESALFPRSPGDTVRVSWTDSDGVSHTASLQLVAGPPA